ncbi:MAG TPA: putative toxin-antitoxin system toxin component, PIN family [Myxococcales bacterium]|nr:putative toxin-antitoxin system toxin component, PIN family [Myxococcales bacterium]
MRAVLDANVYVSAILQPAGAPGLVVDKFLRDASFDVVLSPAIVDEVLRVFGYRKLRKALRGIDAQLWFEDIVLLSDVVADTPLSGICEDPDDDKYFAAALEGRASHVVTGDHRFLELGEHAGVAIVTPRAFLDLLGS